MRRRDEHLSMFSRGHAAAAARATLVHLSPYVDHVTSSVVMLVLVQDDVTVPPKELTEAGRLDGHLP